MAMGLGGFGGFGAASAIAGRRGNGTMDDEMLQHALMLSMQDQDQSQVQAQSNAAKEELGSEKQMADSDADATQTHSGLLETLYADRVAMLTGMGFSRESSLLAL